jgi:effector-binding domain-containing protein
MKKIVGFIVMLMAALAYPGAAQNKIDNERMDRDIEVAENALATMIRQQFSRNRYYGMEIKGNYTPGYGVTLRLPGEHNYINAIGWQSADGVAVLTPPAPGGGVTVIRPGERSTVVARERAEKDTKETRAGRQDSAREEYYKKVVQASKDFLADYGDLISQLTPEEKILITNRGEGSRYYWDRSNATRTLVTVEATKGDIVSYKQGKINRDQMIGKIKVVNTESTNEVETDLELLSSIFNRLYRSDLAKTYYIDEGIYYERLKEFGVIYYVSVVSSIEQEVNSGEGRRWRMPTQKLQDLDQAQRDKKVTEIYPAFEKEIKENIVEYGRTVKSLAPEEMMVFNVRLTKCEKCGIPSNLELSIKNSVLKEYSEGKITREAAAGRINVKKGPAQ